MKRIVAVGLVAALTVLVAVAISRQPDVSTVALTVTVPQSPGDPRTIELDALLYLPEEVPAPAVIMAHGFGSDRTSLDQPARLYAREGYVVLAYSARGFGASQGLIGLDDPDREVADVSGLVDLLASRAEVMQDGPADPRVGIAGGSYGGGLALLAAQQEPRLDAVVAAAAWNSLARSLSPNRAGTAPGVFKSQWASILFTASVQTAEPDQSPDPAVGCGRFELVVCQTYLRVATNGLVDPDAVALLDRSSPQDGLDDITAPTLLIAGLDDSLFGLEESLRNARGISAPVGLQWVPGEHGDASRLDRPSALDFFDVHLRGASTDLPRFSWYDVASGATQQRDVLPGDEETDDGGREVLTLGPQGTLVRLRSDLESGLVPLVHPPGGLPASLSTLPGLGAVSGLLPTFDVPGQSVSFTGAALTEDLTVLGSPRLALSVASVTDLSGSGPAAGTAGQGQAEPQQAVLFIKLYDVTPGGQATLLQSAVNPTRLTQIPVELDLVLEPIARRLVAGNRLRLTVASTDQAYADGIQPSLLTLRTGPGSQLTLPVTTADLVSGVPAAIRLGLPVALITLLALVSLALIRRHEKLLEPPPLQPAMPPASTAGTATAAAEPPDDPVVVSGLVKRYDDGKVAVDGLDLQVGRGQVYGLLGPNGAGKTTTMRMVLGLIRPTEGEIRLLGQPMRPGHPVLRRVGVLVEGPGFAPYLSGRANLVSYWRAGGHPLIDADMDGALDVADLGAAIDKPTRTYSHGMRQRLAIAQALLGRPELLILDEPTDGLDPEQIRGMRQLLSRLGEQGQTVLVSSHLLAEVEQMCTHAAVMQAGRVVAAGPVADLLGATRTMVIQTDERDRARQVLTPLLGPGGIDVEGSGLVVTLDGHDPSTIIATLVTAGIAVSAATPRGRLEDAFMHLTGAAQ
ncbi:MAG: alpha/beta fold hydrolase [Euzebya sp.]